MSEQQILKYIKYTLLAYILFTIYNTLIPFQFNPALHQKRIVDLSPYWDNGHFQLFSDMIGNIILFIPIGFLYQLMQNYGKKRKPSILKTVLLAALFSFCIETTQLFFKYRTTSLTDLINNALGSYIGAYSAVLYDRYLAKTVKYYLDRTLREEPVTLLILIIAAVEFINAMFPFGVGISLARIKLSLAHSNIMPLGYMPLNVLFGAALPAGKSFSAYSFYGDILYFTIYGYLIGYAYLKYWRKKGFALLKVFTLIVIYFPLVELAQAFIRSRFSDINDILSGYLGSVFGILLLLLMSKRRWFDEDNRLNINHFYVVILLYLFYVFYQGFIPFHFSFQGKTLNMNEFIPFYGYYRHASIWNIYDLAQTFFLTMPLGLMIAIRMEGRNRKVIQMRALIVSLLIGMMIETGHIFLASHISDVADIMVMMLGGFFGTRFYFYYTDNFILPKETLKTEGSGMQSG